MRLVYEMDYNGEFVVTTADIFGEGYALDYSTDAFQAVVLFWNGLAEYLSSGLQLRVVRLDQASRSIGAGGGQAQAALPGNCAARFMKVNNGKHGSFNLPGLGEAQVSSGGIIEPGALEGFTTRAREGLADLTAAGLFLAVGGTGIHRPVSDIQCSPRIGTFRNRMFGR